MLGHVHRLKGKITCSKDTKGKMMKSKYQFAYFSKSLVSFLIEDVTMMASIVVTFKGNIDCSFIGSS